MSLAGRINELATRIGQECKLLWAAVNGKVSDDDSRLIDQRVPVDGSVNTDKLASMFKAVVPMATLNVDWSSGQVFTKNLTTGSTLTFSNLHIGVKDLEISGDFTLGLPTGFRIISGEYDGTVLNFIQVVCTNTTTPAGWVVISQGGQLMNNRLLVPKSQSRFQLGSWVTNSAIQSGLSDIGAYSTPHVFEFGGELYLISGNNQGTNDTWKWNGSQWVTDYNIDNGLSDIGSYSHFAVFEISGTYYMIATESTSTFNGYYWDGYGWDSSSGIVNGLSYGYGYQAIDMGYIGSDLYAIVGTNNSTYKWLGFKWNGSGWSSNSTIINGINTDRYGKPCLLNTGTDTYLICGDRTTSFYGYKWNGSGWSSNSQIVDGITPDNFYNVVSAFFLDDTLYAIVGSALGTLRGFMNS